MTEAFLNTPLGAQHDSMTAFLREKDPDEMMLNLGMTLSDDHGGAITAGDDGHRLGSIGGGDGNVNPLPLSAGGEGEPPPPPPSNALLHEGQETREAAATVMEASGGGGNAGVATPDSAGPPPSPPRQPAGMYGGYPSPLPPPGLPPTYLHSSAMAMAAAAGGGSGALGLSGRPGGATPAQDFTYLVRTLGAHGRFEEARARVLPEMRRRGIAPTDNTFVALLAGAAVDRNPDAAEEVGGCRGEGVGQRQLLSLDRRFVAFRKKPGLGTAGFRPARFATKPSTPKDFP